MRLVLQSERACNIRARCQFAGHDEAVSCSRVLPIHPEYRAFVHLRKGVHPRRTGRKNISYAALFEREDEKYIRQTSVRTHKAHTNSLVGTQETISRVLCPHRLPSHHHTQAFTTLTRPQRIFYAPTTSAKASKYFRNAKHTQILFPARALARMAYDGLYAAATTTLCRSLSLSLQPFAPLECQPLRSQLYDLLRIYSTWALIRRMVSPPKLVNAFACE